MRLPGPVIGVLTEDHDLDLVEGCQLERPENLVPRGVYPFAGGLLGPQKTAQRRHVRRRELAGKPGPPACLDPHIPVRRGGGL